MKIFRSRGKIMLTIVLSLMIGSAGFSQQQLTGVVTYAGNEEMPMSDMTVGLYSLQDSLILSTDTDSLGIYFFDSIPSGQYILRSTTTQEATGINIDDAYILLMHLLGLYEFNDMQYEVADVDNTSTVTWNDYIIVLINYLLYNEPFPAGEWKSEEHFLDYSARDSEEEQDTVDMWTNGTSDFNHIPGSGGRTIDFLSSSYSEVEVSGEEFVLNIGTSYSEQINGFNLNLIFPVKKFEVTGVEGPDENIGYSINNETGELKMVWINEMNNLNNTTGGEKLVRLFIKPKQEDVSGESFYLSEKGMVLDVNGKRIENIVIDLPYLKHSRTVKEYKLTAKTYPNPFVDQMRLEIQVNTDDKATISFFDLQGRLVNYLENIPLTKGINSIDINSQKFMPGHYFYTIEFDNNIHERIHGRCYRSSK